MVSDAVNGFVRIDVGLVVAGLVGDRNPVLVQLEPGVGRGGVGEEAVELAVQRERPPAGRDVGGVRCAVPVRHLADVDRAVVRAAQPDGQRLAVPQHLVAAVGRRVAEHAVVVGVLAGQQGRARGAAEGIGGVGVGEGGAGRADQCLGLRQRDHVAHGLVVGRDHDHVRRPAVGGLGALAAPGGREQAGGGQGGDQRRARSAWGSAHEALHRQKSAGRGGRPAR